MRKHLLALLFTLTLFGALYPAAFAASDGERADLLAPGSAYALMDVSVDGASVNVRLGAKNDCALFVGLYDADGKMTDVQSKPLGGGLDERTVNVEFDGAIGADLIARAFLLDADTFAPLCPKLDSLTKPEPDDEFPVEQYVLIERISIETTSAANSKTMTDSIIDSMEDAADLGDDFNSVALQKAYNQTKNSWALSTWDARARLRFSNGSVRTVDLDDAKNYRTDAASDMYNYSQFYDSNGELIPGSENLYVSGTNASGEGDGNWIAEPFTAGHIVRVTNSDGAYRLRAVSTNNVVIVDDFVIQSKGIWDYSSGSRQNVRTNTGRIVEVDSKTHYVVDDVTNNTYKTYNGYKDAPDIQVNSNGTIRTGATAYIYHRDGVAKLIFITKVTRISNSNSSNDIIFIASNAPSKRVESDIGDYVTVSAVIKNEIREGVRIKYGLPGQVQLTMNGFTYSPNSTYATNGAFHCVILNNVNYDSNDLITSGTFNTTNDLKAVQTQGIHRVNSEAVRVGFANGNKGSHIDLAENVRVYYVDKDGGIEQIAPFQITDDTDDLVYYVLNDGEITYLFIVEYTEPALLDVRDFYAGDFEVMNDDGNRLTYYYRDGERVSKDTVYRELMFWLEQYGTPRPDDAEGNYVFEMADGVIYTVSLVPTDKALVRGYIGGDYSYAMDKNVALIYRKIQAGCLIFPAAHYLVGAPVKFTLLDVPADARLETYAYSSDDYEEFDIGLTISDRDADGNVTIEFTVPDTDFTLDVYADD